MCVPVVLLIFQIDEKETILSSSFVEIEFIILFVQDFSQMLHRVLDLYT